MKEKNYLTYKGITLVALVVTIIILLILAGVSIAALNGESGLFSKSKYARAEHEISVAKEKINLKISEIIMKNYSEESRNPTLQELAVELQKDTKDIQYVNIEATKVSSLVDVDFSDITSIFVKLKQYQYEFEIDNSLSIANIVDLNEVKVTYRTVKEAIELNDILNEDKNEELIDENKKIITIPAGFKVINEGNTVDSGIVIEDRSKNQFVWIPVDDYEAFISDEDYGISGYSDDSTEENYQLMIDSVREYKGFYIGRYEAGQSNISQRNEKTFIKATEKLVRDNCSSYIYNSDKLLCSGMYGLQWDAVLRFIAQNEPTYSLTNSVSWGNYNGTEKVVTGYICSSYSSNSWPVADNKSITYGLMGTGLLEENKVLNIYDFAGNIIELTLEKNSSKTSIGRGGGHEDNGSGTSSASGRVTSGRFGYRASLLMIVER